MILHMQSFYLFIAKKNFTTVIISVNVWCLCIFNYCSYNRTPVKDKSVSCEKLSVSWCCYLISGLNCSICFLICLIFSCFKWNIILSAQRPKWASWIISKFSSHYLCTINYVHISRFIQVAFTVFTGIVRLKFQKIDNFIHVVIYLHCSTHTD